MTKSPYFISNAQWDRLIRRIEASNLKNYGTSLSAASMRANDLIVEIRSDSSLPGMIVKANWREELKRRYLKPVLEPADYDYVGPDDNVYPSESASEPVTVVKQVLLADESGIVGMVDADVEPTAYEQRKAAADKIIAAYLALGIEALWAYGKGGGFWLNANATSPARYVSMAQAKKETSPDNRPIQGCELPPDIDETERYLSAYLGFSRPAGPRAPDPMPSDTDWNAFTAADDEEIYGEPNPHHNHQALGGAGVWYFENTQNWEFHPVCYDGEPDYSLVCGICQKPIPSGDICPTCQARKDAYTARRTARVARLQRRAAKKEGEAQGYRKSSDHLATIMNGQPILIGHHSEKRHRRMIDKMDRHMRKSIDLSKQAEHLRHRAKASEEGRQISSDDPEAILKLKEKLAKLEAGQEQMKHINTIVRQVRRQSLDLKEQIRLLSEQAKIDLGNATRLMVPDDLGRIGFCSYQLTNNNAEIRRVKARIAELEKALPLADTDPQVILYPGNVEVTENGPENRLQIRFPAKPSPDIIRQLKGYGFHWSKTGGVWQRMLTNDARWKAESILGKPVQDTQPEPPAIPAEPSTDTPSQLSLL